MYEYAEYIEDAYVAFPIDRHHKFFRATRNSPKKLYAIDSGLVRGCTLEYEQDLGRLFENIVFLDLRRHGYTVEYYKTSENYEIDFIAKTRQGKKRLFQVAWDLDDPKTLKREERALIAAQKELGIEGEIVTLDSYLQRENPLLFPS